MSENGLDMDGSQNPDLQITNPFANTKQDEVDIKDGPQNDMHLANGTTEESGNSQDDENKKEIYKYTEERGLSNLVERYADKLGGYEIHRVEDSGFLLQSKKQLPMAGNDWFLFDYDDTLRGTTEVKNKRLDLYLDYAKSIGVDIPDAELKHFMEVTDKFARWEDTEGGGSTYHANTHMSALHWVTESLKSVDENNRDEVLTGIEQKLQRIKGEIDGEGDIEEGDPFCFKDDKFILKTNFWFPDRVFTPWSEGIKDLFMQSMMNPPDYPASIQAMKEIGGPADSIHRVNMGIFTYGQPYYQLLKVFELLEQNPDTPINQIWLTKVPKGKYIEDLVNSGVNRNTQLEYVKPSMPGGSLDSEEGGISMGSGYPLGEHPHVLVMMDDNPKELNSILTTNEFLSQKTGASFAVVRSRGGGGREVEKEWAVESPNGEVDFRNREFTAKEVSLALQSCRYLNYKARYGETNPKVIELEQRLKQMGSDDDIQVAS